MNEIPINSKIKPNMHPSAIRGTGQSAQSARNALGTLYLAEGKIIDLHAIVKGRALLHQKQAMASMPRPADGKHKTAPALVYDPSASAHIIDVGRPIAQAALKAADMAIVSLGETVTRLDSEINLKVLSGKSSRGEELRAYARQLPSTFQDLGALFQAADKNAALVAAILEGESYLSGLSDENQNMLRVMAASVIAPDQVQARKETNAALDHLTAASKSFVEATASIFNGLKSPEMGAINSIVQTGEDQ